MALVQISDVVVPEIFTPYFQQITEEKARLIQAGVLVPDDLMNTLLAGGGLTFNIPSWQDLANAADNVSTDAESDTIAADFNAGTPNPRLDATPLKTATSREIAVRLSRNQSWSSADLSAALAGSDAMRSIGERVGWYWARRLQAVFVATWNGVILDNTANDTSDYQNDVSGGAFIDGVTNFSDEAFLDTAVTMGDSMENLVAVMVHSVVFNRMQKNNLIDFIPSARGEIEIATYLGREVVVDDGMPRTGNVYDTWLFGRNAAGLGRSDPKVPTEVHRQALAGNGGGQEVLTTRLEWSMHPRGHAYTGTPADGGPGNSTAANDLNNAGSWDRVFPERKQISFARLVTREA